MFVFPIHNMPELASTNLITPFTFLMDMSNNMVSTLMRLSDLQLQATRKLMEESADAVGRSVHIRTFADAQLFVAEQSQLAMKRACGYGQNVQSITVENLANLSKLYIQQPLGQPAHTRTASDHTATKDSASHDHNGAHGTHGAHETDHRPSPLVEKLVASVAPDTDKLH